MDLSAYNYYCPHCDALLSKKNQVVFKIKRNNNEEALLYLKPKPRDYGFECKPLLNFEKDELVDFFCVKCDANLQSKNYPEFVTIYLKVTNNVVFDVFFSRIHGQHKTYVGIEDFNEHYGIDFNRSK